MKRGRQQISNVAGDGPVATVTAAPAATRSLEKSSTTFGAAPARPSRKRIVERKTTPKPHAVVPLPPPPPIQHFSDDSSSDGSSSGDGREQTVPAAKRAKKDVVMTEDPEWRNKANAILASDRPVVVGKGTSKRNFAVVCSSNINRSIMAQKLLEEHDMRAKSYGTGSQVKLPGKDSRSPMSFDFGTPYVEIRDILAREDEALFRRNSVLGLLERDAATKRAPERWQALASEDVAAFDVVVCFESRVFDLVVEDLQQRDPDTFKPLHIVSMTIRDSAEDSAAAAGDVLELCKMLDASEDLDPEASKLLNAFRIRTKRTVLHQVCHI